MVRGIIARPINSKRALIRDELTPTQPGIMIMSMTRIPVTLRRIVINLAILILAMLVLGASTIPPGDQIERVRAFTRDIEFDYISWTLKALGVKLEQVALQTSEYLPAKESRQLVLDYLELVSQIQQGESRLASVYADPNISDPQAASAEQRAELDQLYAQRAQIAPVAESILQEQIAQVVADLGLSAGGQPLPPILYHSTPLPLALIVSPRNAIRQDANISLLPDLTLDQRVELEEKVDHSLDVSSLVVGIGGIGLYPTMVMQTSDINWLSEVVAHEWTHNFLTLRPLGVNYLTSPELRTMNETAASIAGIEISQAVMERFYPELLPPPPQTTLPAPQPNQPAEPPPFDFRAEMRETRVTVDQMLAEGKIDEAEQYMEMRRQFFWENGYRIRKLNQAYFAFYGAYADQPGGAAGEDPVGAAVRQLRAQSPSLADFIKRISWMSSFEELKRAVQTNDTHG
jgi:hypothetical protein